MKRNGIFGLIALLALTAFVVISCDFFPEENNPFEGTWVSRESYTAIFEESSFTYSNYSSGLVLKGTYTFTDNIVRIKYTEISNDGEENLNDGEEKLRPITSIEASNYTSTARIISGNRLKWGNTIYAKQD
jgi:hypothetical protein